LIYRKEWPVASEREIRKEIVEVGKRLYDRGLVSATDGNISARVAPDRVIATPSGVCKGYMSAEELLVVDMKGERIAGRGAVTSEIRMHLAAYEVRPDIQATVHAHPITVTAFTVAGIRMAQCVIPEVVFTLGAVPTSDYATPTTEQGPQVVRELIAECDAVILDRHGALTVAESPTKAYRKMEKLEDAAKITYMARQLGNIRTLPPEEIERLMSVREQMGLQGKVKLCSECGACTTPLGDAEAATDVIELVAQEVAKRLKQEA